MKKILLMLTINIIVPIFSIAYAKDELTPAITQPIPIEQLVGYSTYSSNVQTLIRSALTLSQMKLTYLYGSADPKNKGMDCSGTIYYLLSENKLNDVPRDAEGMFHWVEKHGKLYRVNIQNFNSTEFSHLNPGDLLFWSGTYSTNHSISHVMMYLGKNKKGDRLMFGASDGRTYQGKKMWGVSVFDFQLPDGKSAQKFVGYSCIPDLTCPHLPPF